MCVAGNSAVCSQANKREDHSSFSKSGIRFILFEQTESLHSQFFPLFLPVSRTHTYTASGGPQGTPLSLAVRTLRQATKSARCVSFPASNTVFSTITKPIKTWTVSNESLKTYLLNHENRLYKQNVAVLLQEWEACLESSMYRFVSLNRTGHIVRSINFDKSCIQIKRTFSEPKWCITCQM